MILRPASQSPVWYFVSMLLWRNGLGLEALSSQHFWTHQLLSAPLKIDRSQDGTCSQAMSLQALVLWPMSPWAVTAFIHAVPSVYRHNQTISLPLFFPPSLPPSFSFPPFLALSAKFLRSIVLVKQSPCPFFPFHLDEDCIPKTHWKCRFSKSEKTSIIPNLPILWPLFLPSIPLLIQLKAVVMVMVLSPSLVEWWSPVKWQRLHGVRWNAEGKARFSNNVNC